MGQTAVDEFFRLYVTPGANHGGAGVSATGEAIPQYVDLLKVLDAWVEKGAVPDSFVQTAQGSMPPFAVRGTRPICRYPNYPKYKGSGDPNDASSFTCSNQ